MYLKGLEEELAVYKRASNKNVYLNVACNTIKRLRNETTESCKSPTKPTSPQKMSHEAVLGGKNATKTTFTLNRSGGSYRGPMENFKGKILVWYLHSIFFMDLYFDYQQDLPN